MNTADMRRWEKVIAAATSPKELLPLLQLAETELYWAVMRKMFSLQLPNYILCQLLKLSQNKMHTCEVVRKLLEQKPTRAELFFVLSLHQDIDVWRMYVSKGPTKKELRRILEEEGLWEIHARAAARLLKMDPGNQDFILMYSRVDNLAKRHWKKILSADPTLLIDVILYTENDLHLRIIKWCIKNEFMHQELYKVAYRYAGERDVPELIARHILDNNPTFTDLCFIALTFKDLSSEADDMIRELYPEQASVLPLSKVEV